MAKEIGHYFFSLNNIYVLSVGHFVEICCKGTKFFANMRGCGVKSFSLCSRKFRNAHEKNSFFVIALFILFGFGLIFMLICYFFSEMFGGFGK